MGERGWYDEDRLYPSSRDSDDSPVLSHRYIGADMTKSLASHSPHPPGLRRAKLFLFCFAMILFCVLLYVPVYNKANDQLSKGVVAGWSIDTNRDTKIYVQPNNITTILNPHSICTKHKKEKLFLLIVVCSSTTHFDRRKAIRQTWGKYKTYPEMSKLYNAVKQKYIHYNYSYDLYQENNTSSVRLRRDISSFSRLLPELAKVLQDNLVNMKTDNVPEKRFEDEMLPEFDMNQEIGNQTDTIYDYYDTNVMKIPPKGYEESPDLEKVLTMLKGDKNFRKMKEKLETDNTELEYKVVFLLGLPTNDNDSTIQNKIDEESTMYGDVIQEGFIDSYNNLTLKSIMMLKWITNNCNNSVRYILKTDDDMYINVPNLIETLKNKSRDFDLKTKGQNAKEYMLIGDLICGARPVLNSKDKWYSPRYMYTGRVYPKYLSGTGYALSAAAAEALYKAALRTNYFHLEDIFITGICSHRAHPRIIPRDEPTFSYLTPSEQRRDAAEPRACWAHARATTHRVPPDLMHSLHNMLGKPAFLDICERIRLTKVRKDRLKRKTPPKRLSKH